MQAAASTSETKRRPGAPPKYEAVEPVIEKYLSSVALMSQSTADTYRFRLYPFIRFVSSKHKTTVEDVISQIKAGKLDIYHFLSEYAAYLQVLVNQTGKGSGLLKKRVSVVKLLLVDRDCDINDLKFKSKVRLPKTVRRDKEPIDKADVRRILLACEDPRIKTFLLLLAGTGMRSKEALSLTFADFDLEASPAKVNIRGETTKTRVDRYVFLTKEFVKQFKDYITWRHRERRIYYTYDEDGTKKNKEVIFKPQFRASDLVFSIPHRDESNNATVASMYKEIVEQVNATIDRIGLGEKEKHSGMRKITRHSFRRFVKSTISDLGYGDYSEWFIGHLGSTYYRKKESEKAEIFGKLEGYLTFLDFGQLEAKGADSDSKIESLQDQMLRMERSHKEEMARIMAMIQQNPQLANVKPEVLGNLKVKKPTG